MTRIGILKRLAWAWATCCPLSLTMVLAAPLEPSGKSAPSAITKKPTNPSQGQATAAQPSDEQGEPVPRLPAAVQNEQDAAQPDPYIQLLIATVTERWIVPAALTPGELDKLTATICIKLDDDGQLVESKLVEPSGNRLFDASLLATLGSIKEWPRPQGRFAFAARSGKLCSVFSKTEPTVPRLKFAMYFNRIKRALNEKWNPQGLLSQHDPSGKTYGLGERTTMLSVQLQQDGSIVDLRVLRSSGVKDLDEEALSACRRAQPFAGTPPSLAESDGFIRFQVGFIVQPGKTAIKFYRATYNAADAVPRAN